MADIAAGDVAYTMMTRRNLGDSRKLNRVKLVFGDSALDYPSNGIPLTKGKMGCPTVIESLVIVDKGVSGYDFMYDQSAEKLVIFQAPAQTHTHDIKVIASITEDNTVGISGQIFGKNGATNATIVGANSTANGGVVSATLAAAAMSQGAIAAIAAQTIEVEVIGW